MRRRAFLRVTILLLLGAIINLAVAWGLTLRKFDPLPLDKFVKEELSAEQGLRLWQQHATADWPSQPEQCMRWSTIGYQRITATCRGSLSGRSDLFVVSDIRYGFPSVSMGHESSGNLSGLRYRYALFRVESNPPTWGARWVLPIRPIWPGIAINTIFYAAILWLLFAGPGTIRRWRRIKRGLCPACAYPIGESTVCTECGERLRMKSKQHP